MKKIGLCANWNDTLHRSDMPNDYVKAILAAGGLPVIFPLCGDEPAWKEMIDMVDGVVFTGGGDIDPALFGEELHPATNEIIPQRDRQEIWMVHYVKSTGKPYLGICRGIQVIACAEGGTLYQDIKDQFPTTIDHAQFNTRADIAHHVSIAPDSILHAVSGTTDLPVNSRHHQAVKSVGPHLKATAHSTDGLIEAVEYIDGTPCIAVQWHPESLHDSDEKAMNLFRWLVERAGNPS